MEDMDKKTEKRNLYSDDTASTNTDFPWNIKVLVFTAAMLSACNLVIWLVIVMQHAA